MGMQSMRYATPPPIPLHTHTQKATYCKMFYMVGMGLHSIKNNTKTWKDRTKWPATNIT